LTKILISDTLPFVGVPNQNQSNTASAGEVYSITPKDGKLVPSMSPAVVKGDRMRTDQIKTKEPFKNLFAIKKHTLKAIQKHMSEWGYDHSQPIVIWSPENIVIDGHVRLVAAQNNGLSEIPVFSIEFNSEDEALEYAIHNQRDRRNLADADIASLVEAVDKRKKRGERIDLASSDAKLSPGKSAQETAKIIGTSERKVEKVRTILDHAEPEIKKEVLEGKKSIHKAYTEIQGKRGKELDPEIQKKIYEAAIEEGKGSVAEKQWVDKAALESEIKKAKEDAFQKGYEEAVTEKNKEIENLKEDIARKNEKIRELDLEIDEASSQKLKKEIDKLKSQLEILEEKKIELLEELKSKPSQVQPTQPSPENAFDSFLIAYGILEKEILNAKYNRWETLERETIFQFLQSLINICND
jgi:ParB-like chromosome segregation protein Spo0J